MKLFFSAVLSALVLSVPAQEVRPLEFQEVFSLIRTNLTDVSEAELSRLAGLGLIKELGTKVQLVTNNASAPSQPEDVISRRSTFSDAYAYIQIRSVDDRLPGEFDKWLGQLNTNSTRGIVLDLRFARGEGYTAAAKVAEHFVKSGELLLKLGTNELRSSDQPKILDLPTAVLANKETRAAAEALAGVLREAGGALVIGSTTAGEARLFETFTLTTGQQLKIGTTPVEIAEGKTIPAKGLVPDIAVTVNPAVETILYRDPYRSLTASTPAGTTSTNEVAASTNRARRFNEAELVRRHRAGTGGDEPAPGEAPDQPTVNDPVLARALDFLKGISALQRRPQ